MTTPSPLAHTLPGQSLVNRIVRGLLRAPLLSRVVGARLVTIEVVGRRSGRRFDVPVVQIKPTDGNPPQPGDELVIVNAFVPSTGTGWSATVRLRLL